MSDDVDPNAALIQNVVMTLDLYRFQVRRTVTIKPPSDHPAVLELLRWHQRQLQAMANADVNPPSFGGIS